MTAVGWFDDPFGRHQLRWFSQGNPTSLVRDEDAESHDRPVDTPPHRGTHSLLHSQ